MEFVDGSRARVRGVTIMHGPCADRHVGGWVAARGVEAPRSRCAESRDISHYAFLSGGRHYFTYCRRRRTDCLCQFFHPAKKERPAIWSRNTRIAARTPPQRYSLEFNRIRSPRAIKKNISLRENRRHPLQRGYSSLFGMSLCADVCGDGLVLNITVTENVRIRFSES